MLGRNTRWFRLVLEGMMARQDITFSTRARAFVAGGFLTALAATAVVPTLMGAGATVLLVEAGISVFGGLVAASQA